MRAGTTPATREAASPQPLAGSTETDAKRRSRRRIAAGVTVAVGVGAAAAAGANHARSAPTRRRLQRAHQRRVYRDLGKMALHRGSRFDVDAARKLARAEYRGIRRRYRKTQRPERRRRRI